MVRWSDSEPLDATWEDALMLKGRYPNVAAWGQASSQGAGDVSVPTAEAAKIDRNTAKAMKESAESAARGNTLAAEPTTTTNQEPGHVIARPHRIKHPTDCTWGWSGRTIHKAHRSVGAPSGLGSETTTAASSSPTSCTLPPSLISVSELNLPIME